MTRVLVTGAGGFVGRALIHELVCADMAVAAVARRPEGVNRDAEFRPIADIGPRTDWAPALTGVDAVVHLAARVHILGRPRAVSRAGEGASEGASEGDAGVGAYRRVNLEGTRRLAEAAAAAGVSRFVYLSTVKVHGAGMAAAPLRETDAPAPADPYARSKWEAEEALAEISARTGMEVVILRPPLIYGPGVKGNFRMLLGAIEKGRVLPLGAVENRRSLVYVGNLVNAVRCALCHPAAAGRTYLLRDGEDVSTPELVRRMAAALGRPARLFSLPAPALRAVGLLTGRRDAVARLVGSLVVDDARIREELGWRPPFTMAEGLAHTARWLHLSSTTRDTGGG